MLKSGMVYQPVTVLLNSVTLHTIPHFGKEGICSMCSLHNFEFDEIKIMQTLRLR
jgi:hypothetical protein